MAVVPQEPILQFEALMEEADESLKKTFQNVHQGYPQETLTRFLKARDGNVAKAHKMLLDCLKWRVENEIDEILAKPIVPTELYKDIRDSQLIGLSGYTHEGLPVFAIGVGLSSYNKASDHYYTQSHIQLNEYRDRLILHGKHIRKCIKILDMTGLKRSSLDNLKLMRSISSIDDLNYPEITHTYYIVNSPLIFSACWRIVKPLLQERTRNKIKVLSGCGEDELLKIMHHRALPHFCHKRSSSSLQKSPENCYSLDHPFHQQMYSYMKQQQQSSATQPEREGSVHVTVPEGVDEDIEEALESQLEQIKDIKVSDSSRA